MAQDTQVLQLSFHKTTNSVFVPTNPHLSLSVISTFEKKNYYFFFWSWTLRSAVLSVDRPCDTPELS